MNYLNKRISSLEERLQHNGDQDPMSIQRIRDLAKKSVSNVPRCMENGISELKIIKFINK